MEEGENDCVIIKNMKRLAFSAIISFIGAFLIAVSAEAAVVNSVQKNVTSATMKPVDMSRSIIACAGPDVSSSPTLVLQNYHRDNGCPDGPWDVVEFKFGVRVQRGTVDLSNNLGVAQPHTININFVDPTRSFVLVSARERAQTGSQGPCSYHVQARLVSLGGGVEFRRGCGSSVSDRLLADWQVVEFEDAAIQRGTRLMDSFSRSVQVPIRSVNTSKSLVLLSEYALLPGYQDPGHYPVADFSDSRTVAVSRQLPQPGGSPSQQLRLAWEVVEFIDLSRVQAPNTAIFSSAAAAVSPAAAQVKNSVCELICPATGTANRSSVDVSLRFVNPDSPTINTSATFRVPLEITPVGLGSNTQWDQAQRLLTVFLGAFRASEEKQINVRFEGEPSGCVVYGTLQGEWSPAPEDGLNTWQEEVNFSTVLPEERCLATNLVTDIINRITEGPGGPSGPGGPGGIGGPGAPGQTFGNRIENAIENLRNNEIVQTVGLPLTAGTVAAAAAATAASVPFAWNLLELLRFILLGFLRFKKRTPWGIVYDEAAHRPIAGAVVKILDTEFHKVKETQISDGEGRFGFLVPPGSYYIRVSKSGYKDQESPVFNIADPKKEVPNLEIGLHTLIGAPSIKHLQFRRTTQEFRRLLHLLNPYLLAIGTILSILMFILFPTLINYAVLMIYVVLDAYKIWLMRHTVRPYGRVLDRATDDPLPLSIVRAFHSTNNWLTATHVTDEGGRYNLLLNKGSYYMTSNKEGYQPFKSEEIDLRKPGSVTKDIEMKRGN